MFVFCFKIQDVLTVKASCKQAINNSARKSDIIFLILLIKFSV